MRDDSTGTTGQGGSAKASLVADPAPTYREDSTEDVVQPAVCCRPINRSVAEANRS